MKRCKSPSALIALLAAITLPAAVEAARTVEETRDLAPDGRVEVENVAGEVIVRGWDRAEVRLRAELDDRVEELDISSSDDRFSVRVQQGNGRSRAGDAHLRLDVPRAAEVRVSTVSAGIRVEDIEGAEVQAESVSGDVDVTARVELAELESVSGDVTFGGASRFVRAESVSGDVTVRGVETEVEVSTVSGDLELEGGALERGRFETVSGDLELDLSLADQGRLTVESMSGDVDLGVPATQAAEFSAQTFSGSIRSDFGTVERQDRGSGERLEHREGAADASFRLESFSGDIYIRRR